MRQKKAVTLIIYNYTFSLLLTWNFTYRKPQGPSGLEEIYVSRFELSREIFEAKIGQIVKII